MKRIILLIIVSLIMLPLSIVASDNEDDHVNELNALLKGNYSFTINQKCEVNVEQVVDDLQLLSEPIIVVGWIIDGAVSFGGDGTGDNSFHALRFISGRQETGNTLSGWSEGTCNLTYEVSPDRSFSGELICTGINSTGKSFITSGIQVQGNIAKDKQMLILSDSNPIEENIYIENFGTLIGTCGRSGTAIKIQKK